MDMERSFRAQLVSAEAFFACLLCGDYALLLVATAAGRDVLRLYTKEDVTKLRSTMRRGWKLNCLVIRRDVSLVKEGQMYGA